MRPTSSGAPFQIIPAEPSRPDLRSSTLDVGVCLLGKALCCPGGVGTEASEVGCSSSVGARALRGVGPRDRAPQQQQQLRGRQRTSEPQTLG
ncbi:unnamed protein product [Boreogadus saida]